MLFETIRFVFWCVALVVCRFIIAKSGIINKRKWYIITFAISLVSLILISLVPIENVFVTFSSPEESYRYNHNAEVELVVDGEKTDFVVGMKDATIYNTIIPKTKNGWKLGMASDTKKVRETISEGICIDVYQYKNTSDYYITVFDMNGDLIDVSDSNNSEFQKLDNYNRILNKNFFILYAYVNDFDEDYTVTVNGRTITQVTQGTVLCVPAITIDRDKQRRCA